MSELSLQQIDYEFINGDIAVQSGAPQVVRGVHSPDDITYAAINERITEGNDTYGVFTGQSGLNYEIAAFNTVKSATATVWKSSTSFSSILKNPGNLTEIALTAALNPEAQYVYIASFGNRPTSRIPRVDMSRVASSGRYTFGDGALQPFSPLDSVHDMAQTAIEAFGAPTHLTADSEGSRLSLGLATALAPDSLRGLYLNAPDGISPAAHYIGSKLLDDFESRYRRRHQAEQKSGDLTPTGIKNTKLHAPDIYHGIGRVAHLAPLPIFLYPGDVADKIRTTLAFRKHDDLADLADHAVYQDTSAALRQHNAPITMHFTTESDIHDIDDCVRFGELVMNNIPAALRTPQRRIRLLVGGGGIDHHTDAPYDRARTERQAFPDISHPLMRIAGNLSISEIFDLPVIKTA